MKDLKECIKLLKEKSDLYDGAATRLFPALAASLLRAVLTLCHSQSTLPRSRHSEQRRRWL